ncbi:MAG: hypothetical protein ACK526_06130 [Planctomyces sp.]
MTSGTSNPKNSERSIDPQKNDSSLAEELLNDLLFGLSLPERFLRSAVGITAGTAKELASFVVPQAFQDSKSYEVAVRNSLGFLISGVGTLTSEASEAAPSGSPSVTDVTSVAKSENPQKTAEPSTIQGPHGAESPGRYLARKAASNFIDIAGFATLHVSPLWVLAIVSDVAYGTQTYLNELTDELKAQGLIDNTSTIHHVEDLFDAVKKASGTAASAFDQPPLSLDELRSSIDQTRQALNEIDPTQLIPEAEIGRYWSEMKDLAVRENVSLLGVSGAIAMQTVEGIRNLTHGSLTGLFVAGQIVNRNIFGHYLNALDGIRQQGIWHSVRDTYEPYVDLAWKNFTSSRKTWTEQVLHPGNFARFWSFIRNWIFGKKSTEGPRSR